VRSLARGWGKTLAAALAVHLAVFVGLFAVTGAAPPPPPEPVVIAQLIPPAATDAATSPALPAAPDPAAPAQPVPARPAPKIKKNTAARPQPAKLVTKAPSHKTPPPAAPVPVTDASVTPAPVVAAASAPSAAGQPTIPTVSRPGAGTAASAAAAVTIQPKPIRQPRPAYPASAQRRGLEGKVILQVTVGADGAVRAVAVSRGSSYSSLDDAAVAGVWNWRFLPGKVGGEAKEMTISLPVDFRLR
jgi:protein TonB